MRTFFILFLLATAPSLFAQGVVVNLVRAGIGATPIGDCRSDLAQPDCRDLDGTMDITVAPGAEVALFLEWRNDGSATITEVRATDQMGNPLFPPVNDVLLPTQLGGQTVFFNAPVVPGTYATLLTLTAEDANGRDDTDQFRYFITVDQSLPVELAEFSARLGEKAAVDLHWRTSSERGSAHFVVERSSDGLSFVALGAVAGAGDSNEEQAYVFRDAAPPAGENLYRLKQVDLDGTFRFSPMVSVRVTRSLAIYPNPAGEVLFLPGFAGGQVEIYDALGRVVLRQSLVEGSPLPVGQLRAGLYRVRAGAESGALLKQ